MCILGAQSTTVQWCREGVTGRVLNPFLQKLISSRTHPLIYTPWHDSSVNSFIFADVAQQALDPGQTIHGCPQSVLEVRLGSIAHIKMLV